MKFRMILMLVICFLFVQSGLADPNEPNAPVVEEDYFTLRLTTEPVTGTNAGKSFEGWFGIGKGKSEVGPVLTYADTEEFGTNIGIGVFTMYHLPDVKDTLETILWPIDILPDDFTIKPAIGLEGVFDNLIKSDAGKRGEIRIAPVFETVILDKITIQTKYNMFSGESDKVDGLWFGVALNFKF